MQVSFVRSAAAQCLSKTAKIIVNSSQEYRDDTPAMHTFWSYVCTGVFNVFREMYMKCKHHSVIFINQLALYPTAVRHGCFQPISASLN